MTDYTEVLSIKNKLKNKKYTFIGSGIIAGVLIERLIKSGSVLPENIIASDVKTERLAELNSLIL